MIVVSVTADDLGYCKRRNKGILELLKTGIVSKVSLLVNAEETVDAVNGFRNAVDKIREKCGRPPTIGLHFNLTEGKPLSQVDSIPSLVDESGNFFGKHGFRDELRKGNVIQDEIQLELDAQVKYFQTLLGNLPAYVDGHQHVHVIPYVASIFSTVLKSYGILNTRVPLELQIEECSWLQSIQLEFYKQVCKDALQSSKIFRSHDISFSDFFVGLSTFGTHMNEEVVSNALEKVSIEVQNEIDSGTLRNKNSVDIEFMVHPGYRSMEGKGGCGDGPDDFSLSVERELEMDFLNKKLIPLLLDLKIKLQ